MSNRASYQRHNPNMSLKPVNAGTKKQPCIAFKSANGVMFSPLNKGTLRTISTYCPDKTTTDILIDLVHGKELQLPLIKRVASLVYK